MTHLSRIDAKKLCKSMKLSLYENQNPSEVYYLHIVDHTGNSDFSNYYKSWNDALFDLVNFEHERVRY